MNIPAMKGISSLLFIVGTLTIAHGIPVGLDGQVQQKQKYDVISPEVLSKGVRIVEEFLRSVATISRNGQLREANANEYVDKMLVNLKEYIKKNMEPLNVGAQGDDIKRMQLYGLSSIYRSGEASIKQDGQTILLSVNLGFSALEGEADIEKNVFWEIWISGTAKAKIRGLSLYGAVRIDLLGSGKPQLEDLSVNDWGNMETSFEGDNWLGILAEYVTGQFPGIIDNILKSNLLTWVRQGVEYVLQNIDFNFQS